MATLQGTIEVLTNNEQESTGLPVKAATAATVPVIIEAVFGYSAVEAVETTRAGAVAEWTAMTPENAPATVVLWPTVDLPLMEIPPVEEPAPVGE